MRFIFLVTFYLLTVNALAQCPIVNFNIQPSACINEKIVIESSAFADSLIWDFCSKDLEAPPNVNIVSDVSSKTAQPWGYEVVEENGNWYGFIMSRGLFLARADFGNSLSNTPAIVLLGNPSDLLNQPERISIIKHDNSWYAVVTQNLTTPNNNVVLLEFGSDITSTPTARILGNFGLTGKIRSIKIIKDNQNLILIVADSGRKLTFVNFRDSFESLLLPEHIITTGNLDGANFIFSIDALKVCDNWYVFTSSYSSDAISKIKFGSNLFSLPTEESSIIFPEIDRPQGISVFMQGEIVYVGISSDNINPVNLISYQNISSTSNPILLSSITQNLPLLTALDINYENGEVFLNGIYSGNRLLYQINYKNDCSVSQESDNSVIPPPFSYGISGSTDISLNGFNNDGSTNGISQQITISPSLAPQLTAQIIGNCLTSPINFSGQQLSGNITNWDWNFGDGIGTSAQQNDTYSYATAGSYQVKLSVTDANGCNNLYIDTVHVYEEPIPDFTVPAGNLCMNNEILFTNTTTGESGQAVTWTWDFNGEGNSNEKEPNFAFLAPGSKIITLTSSIPGCANVTQQTINIEESPTTAYSFNNTCNGGLTTFLDETTGNNLTAWHWNFGDGSSSTSQSPTHTYAASGNYIVTLMVSNNVGCTTTKIDTVYSHSLPVVNFANDLPCSSSPISFTDQSLVANANMIAWQWNFGDGTTSTEQHPTHTYNQTGNFVVELTAFSQFGCAATSQSAVSIAQGPQTDFEWNNACEGEATTFTDLTNTFGIPILGWSWLIDGALLTNQHPTYTFTSSGTYAVQLTTLLNNNCTQTTIQDVLVEVPPTVQFDYTENCINASTTFYDLTDQTDNDVLAREWRVDGIVFSTDSAAVTMLTPTNYNITLSIITQSGCEETTTKTVSLMGSPLANFTINSNLGAAPFHANFTNESAGGSTYLWQFGDENNTVSTEPNPTFTYTKVGNYTVTLQTFSTPNCYNEFTQQLEIVEPNSSAEIIAITPIANGSKTNFIITLHNSGSTLINQSSNLVFRADYGAEIIEPIHTIIYAGNTINYQASFALAANNNVRTLCVKLINENAHELDRNCINLNGSIQISAPYPNPSKGIITIDVLLKDISDINIRVLNRTGQPVIIKSIEGIIGLNQLTLNGQVLAAGLYIIEVNVAEKIENYKISIIR